ncbi:ArsR/SmtB family transcription factor [Methylobacterium isbiliense]|uniref:HTH-type transcriptional regulator n=1 Tax=Methylobacterium isbiliense TaxID=315478 RepID=A0ABQ4SLQ5_9HYPH|nr:metalloregulator ArsR/SmtB family transcription factor [Methylobacterium isbiliense]MDN3625856.1 metalloregulator ArsR/SmtB family transcription factor [Methylobacterium isbiliense]GJE02828.1 HTH-type transcriptional regulator [Methylobacterium isbiliense]
MANAQALLAITALGDPTRRQIFEHLAHGPSPVGELASTMAVTRPAVSQHLRVLKEAGLVTETAQGTRRIYRLDRRGISAVHAWLDERWAEALNATGSTLEQDF